jgi:phosphoribosylaminoimidazolecarboxamide formyltransferase/IMP cyclohydrolase
MQRIESCKSLFRPKQLGDRKSSFQIISKVVSRVRAPSCDLSKEIHPMTELPIRRALLSVSDKRGLAEFAAKLSALNVNLVSTGGSAKLLKDAGLPVQDISELTGMPEMLDGRVKTLHPKVHGGLLNIRDNAEHRATVKTHAIPDIDLVVVNLYPFEETIAKGADAATAIENIDIGGPAMIRSAAKNHAFVTVVVDTDDYARVLNDMEGHGGATSLALRKELAAKAYARTAAYDMAISNWFARDLNIEAPAFRTFGGKLKQTLRYGENPHQTAAFYADGEARPGVATATQIQGKELSYNNINDTDAAFELVSEFDPKEGPACAIIKHANPCGIACGASLMEAYRNALRCDPVSAFGGIVAFNQELDEQTAEDMIKVFTEVIIAPEASQGAREILATKKNLRPLLTGGVADPRAGGLTARSVAGGMLVQSRDNGHVARQDLKVVTKRAPSDAELADLAFAFTVAKHVKSNTIVYAKNRAAVGIGAGQMSRVDSARIAARKAQDAADAAGDTAPLTQGSVAASDAFFPFADGLLTVIEAGATAVVQPGGSMRDDEVIAAADEAGIAMVFTGMRHFRH